MCWVLTGEDTDTVEIFVDQLQALAVIDFVSDCFDLLRSDGHGFLTIGNLRRLDSQVGLEIQPKLVHPAFTLEVTHIRHSDGGIVPGHQI